MTREEYLEYFRHMEDQEVHHGPLGGMAWDDVSWFVYDAVYADRLFALAELKELFPRLLGHFTEFEVLMEGEKG